MKVIVLLFLFATSIAISHGLEHGIDYKIHPLRLKSGSGGHYIKGISCSSWRLGVEAHNIIEWKTIPQECEGYVGNYVLGGEYRADSKVVNREAYLYAKSVDVIKDGKNIWVFDIDETSLSNLPYYAHHGFGVEPYNATAFEEWVNLGIAPPLPETQKLYNKLLSLGFKIAFLTGRPESQKNITVKNLKYAGYYKWEKLILKLGVQFLPPQNTNLLTIVNQKYKSRERKKVEEEGYRVIGNIGDQWSDILGTNTGNRTFKLPDPLYYIA